jgi:hypothetical protein
LKSVVLDIHENCSNFNKKVSTVNSEVLAVHLKNIESPGLIENMYLEMNTLSFCDIFNNNERHIVSG